MPLWQLKKGQNLVAIQEIVTGFSPVVFRDLTPLLTNAEAEIFLTGALMMVDDSAGYPTDLKRPEND